MAPSALPNSYSDGSQEYWPEPPYEIASDDTFYQEKLAKMWKQDMNATEVTNSFESLPSGYAIFVKRRKDNSGTVDRYIFGHKHGRFDSPIKFYVHFKHLMSGGVTECSCVKCIQTRTHRVAPRYGSRRDSHIRVPVLAEEEISEKVSGLIRSTYYASKTDPANKYIVENIENEASSDRIHDGINFADMLKKYQDQPSFLPRRGELVLFYTDPEPNCELYFEKPLQHIKIYSHSSNRSLGYPRWKAAIICGEPQDKLGIKDLEPNRAYLPSSYDRRLQYKLEVYEDQGKAYEVPLSHIRPLSVFHELLSGLEQADWHESILNALKKMNSACVVGPLKFFGDWPNVAITFSGIWLGSELFTVGDTVRVKDRNCGAEFEVIKGCVYVVRIHQIAYELSLARDDAVKQRQVLKIKGDLLGVRDGGPLSGAITNIIRDSNMSHSALSSLKGYECLNVGAPNSSNYVDVAAGGILGRLYESRAMEILTGNRRIDTPSLGLEAAREYAGCQSNGDLLSDDYDRNWLLSKDRIEALQIQPNNLPQWDGASLSASLLSGNKDESGSNAEETGGDEEYGDEFADVDPMEYDEGDTSTF